MPIRAVCLIFAGIQAVEAIVWYIFVGSVASRVQALLRQDRVRRRLDKISAAIFLLLGLNVALDAG